MRVHNGTDPDLIEDEDRFTVRLWKEVKRWQSPRQPHAGAMSGADDIEDLLLLARCITLHKASEKGPQTLLQHQQMRPEDVARSTMNSWRTAVRDQVAVLVSISKQPMRPVVGKGERGKRRRRGRE